MRTPIIGLLVLAAAAAHAGEAVDKTLDVKANGLVRIENVRGEISVDGWERDQVQVVGTLDDRAKALTFETVGATTTVRVETPDNLNRGEGSKLVIHVPQTSRVRVELVSAQLRLTNLKGGVDAKTVSGDIEAADVGDRIELATISGDITLGHGVGPTSFSSVSGDIKADAETSEIKIQTVSGGARVTSSARVQELTMHSVSGDLEVSANLADGAHVKGSTTSGDIRLAINPDAGVVVEMKSTAGGGIRNTLTHDRPSRDIGGSASLDLTLGNGQGGVELSTVSGRLELGSL
ncbi:MAG TPA: DUF4097 family beta strand repeat-containing protein [Pseudomonadales bacterium]|nr:DUF4097 family beta strand repeat-containing protein [Pseudomonadales bacterium]